jgi:hypothetical protein
MMNPGDRSCFDQKPLSLFATRPDGCDELQRHLPFQRLVMRQIHLSHATAPERTKESKRIDFFWQHKWIGQAMRVLGRFVWWFHVCNFCNVSLQGMWQASERKSARY